MARPRKKPGTQMVDRLEEARRRAKARAAVRPAGIDSNVISIKGGVLSHKDAILDQPLPVIILDEIVENSWFEKEYVEGEYQSPECYAYSEPISTNTDKAFGSGMAPHEKSHEPQNSQCEGCWANEWESARKGKGKACGNRRRLLLLEPNTQDIAVIKVPPSGLNTYDAYVRQLERIHETVPEFVITEITLEKLKPTDQSAIPRFRYAGPVPDEVIEKIDEMVKVNRDMLLMPFPEPREETKRTAARKKAPAPRKKTTTRRRK